MSQSLPTPGGDVGTWGTILNNFLSVSLVPTTGALQSNVVADAQVASGAAINPTKINGTAEVQTNKGAASGYAPLNSSSLVPIANLGSGSGTTSTFLRGDGSWVAALQTSGGTMSGAIAMGNNKITGLANGTASTDAAAFGQIPTSLAPSGSAGGDLSSTYPNPTVAKIQGVSVTAAEGTLVSQLNNATTRSATATLNAGEETIFTGSTASQTLTLPTSPQASSMNTVINLATVNVTLAAGGSNTINTLGTSGSLTIVPNASYSLVFIGTTWYVINTNTVGNIVGSVGGDLTGTLPNPTVSGTANVESVIRANSLDQMTPPAANLNMNNMRIIQTAAGQAPTDVATMASATQWTSDTNAWTYLASFTATGTPTNTSTTVTSSAAFTDVAVGMSITGTNIPTGTIVIAIASTSSITISQAATGSPGAVTLTFGSATSQFTVPGNYSAIYLKGLKLKWVQSSTTYYGVVYGSNYDGTTNTYVTMILNASYSLQNAGVSSQQYSWGNPSDFPTSFGWNPTLTGFSSNPSVGANWWALNDGLMTITIGYLLAGTSNATTFSVLNAPIAAGNTTGTLGSGLDNNVSTIVTASISHTATLLTLYKGFTSGAWTNSGSKNVIIEVVYPI